MKYVFDTGPLIILFKHYYRERFPSLWQKFDPLVEGGEIISVREVFREVTTQEDQLAEWAKANKGFFPESTVQELQFVRDIFAHRHFQAIVSRKESLAGKPVADPFVIARAKTNNCPVVTSETFKNNAAMIPNICRHFGVAYINLEEFMQREGWTF